VRKGGNALESLLLYLKILCTSSWDVLHSILFPDLCCLSLCAYYHCTCLHFFRAHIFDGACTRIHTHTHTPTHPHTHAHIHTHTHTTYTHTYTHTLTHTHTHTHTQTHSHTTYTHTYTHTLHIIALAQDNINSSNFICTPCSVQDSVATARIWQVNLRMAMLRVSFWKFPWVGQNCVYTPYMTVSLVISLPKIPYIQRL